MKKYKVYFSFELNNLIWNFDKEFYSKDINSSIEGYLSKKSLPLDLINFKTKITNL